jgi:hypothetical protein
LIGDKERYYLQKPDNKTHYVLRDYIKAEALAMTNKRVYRADSLNVKICEQLPMYNSFITIENSI